MINVYGFTINNGDGQEIEAISLPMALEIIHKYWLGKGDELTHIELIGTNG